MAEAVIHAAVEIPRRAVVVPGQGQVSPSAWQVGELRLLERAVKAALSVTSAEHTRLLTTETDQGVFELVERYGTPDTDLGSWIERISQSARAADPQDLVMIIRPDIVLKSYESLGRAVAACRELERVERVEPAYRPKRYPLENIVAIDRKLKEPQPWSKAVGVDGADLREMGYPCPAFEVIKLRRFRRDQLGNPTSMKSGFVWIDEDDFVLLESSLDWLRVEQMLD